MILNAIKYDGEYTAKAYIEANNIWIKLIKSLSNNFKDNVCGLKQKDQEDLIKAILISASKNDKGKSWYKNNNLEDFKYYIENNNRDADNRCRNIEYSIKKDIYSSNKDMEQYSNFICKHFNKMRKNKKKNTRYYIIGGHTHHAAKYTGTSRGPLENCIGIYEIGKFYDNNGLNYGLLSVGNSDAYQFFGESCIEKNELNASIETIMNTE